MAKDKETINNKQPTTDEKSPIALREEEILKFWKEKNIFQKSLEKPNLKDKDFVFYEGPPTANGRPGIHHLESRAFKDIIPRYKTMRGFHVDRRAGWDTHGLPVELEVEKKLGFKSKKEIEVYGIEKFNEECKKSAWTYIDEWKEFTERMGFWLDFDNAYVTYKPEYIESVWNILAKVNEQNLLYKDYRVVPWCPRDGTALSSHELAQGYQDDKDLSVYIKFKIVDFPDAYFIAWTTTPWTLLGNVALAVGLDIVYVEAKVGKEIFVVAKDRLSIISEPYEIVAEHKGSEMVGMKYEPLYPLFKDVLPANQKDKLKNAFQIYPANFVTTEDGTGIVHTAVMYGQDDFELGTKYDLPKYHLVDEAGNFTADTGPMAGKFVKDEEVAVDIIKDMAKQGLLYKKEKHTHSYPHCWRCGTPLIYYARDSWYIRMSSLREKLLSENEKINWEPEYIRDGRFGEWLREVKDWAISRERYWGTPLPVWQTENKSETLVVDSIDTLKKYTKHNDNKFFVVRHGGSEANEKFVVSFANESGDHLTAEGKIQAKQSAEELKNKKIDVIISSPFARTMETAKIIADELGLSEKDIISDERLKEINPGDFDGKDWNEYHRYIHNSGQDWYYHQITGGESLSQVGKRVGECLYDLESRYQNKNILVVTHGGPAWLAYVISGLASKEIRNEQKDNESIFVKGFKNAEVRPLPFIPLPHNNNFEIDLHKPFIDEVVLVRDGKEFRRVKEVMDVWFDSGSMPFSQNSVDRGEKTFDELWKDIPYPADYISEGIDQTRGWFYTLHAIGVLMGKGLAFQNVICLGLILDKNGQKMSKSKGNAVNPFEMMDKYGVDALRFWMYTVNQPGESKNFDEKTVDDVIKKVFNLLLNVVKFYELYVRENEVVGRPESKNVLDQWMLSYLDETTLHMTRYLEDYKVLEAGRLIKDFIADLSQWYVRRSRDRFKESNDAEDRKMAVATLQHVLVEFSKLIAPFMPFLAEDIYQRMRTADSKESVHLESWPESFAEKIGNVLSLTQMQEVRRLTTLALEARAKAGIKVRQPLSLLTIKGDSLVGLAGHLEILADEVNVKKVVFNSELSTEVELDTVITTELKQEGGARELIRAIQETRKERGLSPDEKISITLGLNEWGMSAIENFKKEIIATCSLLDLKLEEEKLKGDEWFKILS